MPQHTYYAVPIVIVTRDSKLCVASEEDEHVALKTNAIRVRCPTLVLLVLVVDRTSPPTGIMVQPALEVSHVPGHHHAGMHACATSTRVADAHNNYYYYQEYITPWGYVLLIILTSVVSLPDQYGSSTELIRSFA